MRQRQWVVTVLAAGLAALALPGPAFAGRIVDINIELDGKAYLAAAKGDSGLPPPEAVWRYLAVVQLHPEEGVKIAPDPADPLRLTVRGKIAIDVRYGGKATVSELHLTRSSPDAGWSVLPEDVERIAKEIGLGEPPPPSPEGRTSTPLPGSATATPADDTLLFGIAVGAVVVVVVLGVLFIRSVRRSGGA